MPMVADYCYDHMYVKNLTTGSLTMFSVLRYDFVLMLHDVPVTIVNSPDALFVIPFQVIVGAGFPLNTHKKNTLLDSRTTIDSGLCRVVAPTK